MLCVEEAVGYDLEVVVSDEAEYLFTHPRGINVGLDAFEGVENRGAALVDMSVGLGYIVDLVLGEAAVFAHHYGIYAIICGGIMGDDDIRRHVRADAATAFDENEFADAAFLVDNSVRRKYGAFVDYSVAGYGDAVAEDAFAHDVRVVAYMAVCHDEASVADACTALAGDAAVDYDMFADDVIVADIAICLLAFPSEILRVGAYDCTLVDFVAAAHARASDDACIGHDLAVVADLDVGVDIGESVNGDVVAEFGARVDVC